MGKDEEELFTNRLGPLTFCTKEFARGKGTELGCHGWGCRSRVESRSTKSPRTRKGDWVASLGTLIRVEQENGGVTHGRSN
jgi:hypothetical protein